MTTVLKFIQRLESFDNLLKDSFHELFIRVMSESLILFDQEFYKQYDEVARSFPSGLTLANAFSLLPSKNESLKLSFWGSVIYRKQVDHKSFVFFSKHYMPTKNCQWRKIRFTSETDCENSLLFFDNKIGRSNKKFIILVYCKGRACYTGHLASDQTL